MPRVYRYLMLLAAMLFVLPASAEEYGGLMIDYDLPGQDIRAMDISDRLRRHSNNVSELQRMNVELAAVCRARCDAENRCRAWTYKHNGNRPLGDDRFVWIGRCFLKDGIPTPAPRGEYGDYISGVKDMPEPPPAPAPPQARRQWKDNVDLPGSDYRSFVLKQANPAACLKACRHDAQCQAWTMVRPGFQGPLARCWLKDEVPPAQRNDCCISGVKH